MDRDELIDKINSIVPMCLDNAEDIADFIISDRQRIVAPLVQHNININGDEWEKCDVNRSISETLKLAGITL